MRDAMAAIAVGHEAQIVREQRLAPVAQRQRDRGCGLAWPSRAGRARRVAACGRSASRWWMRPSAARDGRDSARARAPTAIGSTPGCSQKRRSSSASVARATRSGRIVERPVAVVDPPFAVFRSALNADLGEEGAVAVVEDRRRRPARRGARARTSRYPKTPDDAEQSTSPPRRRGGAVSARSALRYQRAMTMRCPALAP